MKKKTKTKPRKKPKPKYDRIQVILESLLNLELQVKALIKTVDRLEHSQPHYPKDVNEAEKQYWPNRPWKYDKITWYNK